MTNNTNNSENRADKNKDFFKLLETGMQYYDTLIIKTLEENKIFDTKTIRPILSEFHAITEHLIIKQNLGFYFKLVPKIYFIADKLKIHQFTHRYLDILDFAKEIKGDITLDSVLKRDVANISSNPEDWEEYLNDRLEMFSESFLPKEWNTFDDDFIKSRNISARKNLYLQDYCFKLGQTYETFLIMATFTLILCRYILKEPTDKLIEILESKKKLSSNRLYSKPKGNQDINPLLKVCFSKIFRSKSQISIFFEEVFKPNGIRDIRNRIIHHYSEKEKCEITEDGLKITFDDGIVKYFSINDLDKLYGKFFSITVLLYFHSLREQLNAIYILGKDLEYRDSKEK
jgi:hypothetical protein